MYMSGVCMYMCGVHVLCVVIKPHWSKISTQTNFSVMELQVLIFKVLTFYYLWCECVCMYMCGVHVLLWCPCVVTAVLLSLFLFWSYFTRVVFHTS